MLSITPKELTPVQVQAYLQAAVGPRPIALASTIDEDGNANLSPFSFFNIFSSNPPILIFSPARRVRNNTIKHTLINAEATKEVVINIVNYDIVQQISLASTEYGDGVDEFVKAGLTKVKSDVIKPYRVAESPVQLECKVNQIVPLGTEGGAGNLVICEVVKIHIHEHILNENGAIDQAKIDLVARMGGNWYTRANAGMFEVEKPLTTLGIGVDSVPDEVKKSDIFVGNDLGKLGNIEHIPTIEEVSAFLNDNQEIKSLLDSNNTEEIYKKAKELLDNDKVLDAWKIIVSIQNKN
ncbi:flavin reductase family protein [Paenimyroides tangerinum]|uniref:Flavin reductase family protein n=1 Tax=Paenimyroides tangerinum TaxID=2488728 RepID=A0A3P3W2F4_9FLAO|nr:flavin reductase family protein [Paenimyroides tangerinum]RRJ88944.1 flavin reductase family protein [Paenimyroides tangerinum]RRJ92320.1 flavin reductase family protein [Paenimyroides tangerinum]